jgi:NTE family protein
LNGKAKGVGFDTRKQLRYEELLKGKIDVDFVARLERKNDSHTISNKIFYFTKNTIIQLIQDGYEETKGFRLPIMLCYSNPETLLPIWRQSIVNMV